MVRAEDLTHEQKAVAWVMGAVTELTKEGMFAGEAFDVNGTKMEVTVFGTGLWDQLDASGFRPSFQEVVEILPAVGINDRIAAMVVCAFAANREELLSHWEGFKESEDADQL